MISEHDDFNPSPHFIILYALSNHNYKTKPSSPSQESIPTERLNMKSTKPHNE